jgi:hypothetical protein
MIGLWYYIWFLHWLHMAGSVILVFIWLGRRLSFKFSRFSRLTQERGFWKLW